MEDPLLEEDDLASTADATTVGSGNDNNNVGVDGVSRRLEQDELTSDGNNETRPRRHHGISTLAFVVVPMVIFLASTFVAAAFLPPSPNPPTENSDDDGGDDGGPSSSM